MQGQPGVQVGAHVGSIDLSQDDANDQIIALKAASPKVRGVRYILDYVGPFDGKTATHVATKRHGLDYLRDPVAAPKFERGFALLAEHKLSFDLQCAPEQLSAAVELFTRHPGVPVVLLHLGKPRLLKGDGSEEDQAKLAVWRDGLTRLAALPHVSVKLSMLGYAVPGWHESAEKEAFLKSLVLEVISLFGAERCMFASNFHINAACSDSDGQFASGPSVAELYAKFNEWTSELSTQDRANLFAGASRKFYRF